VGEIERFLAPDEDFRYLSRKHLSVLYRRSVMFVLAVIVGSAAGFVYNPSTGDDLVDWIAGALVALIGLRLLAAMWRWRSEQIALTHRRLIVTSGLFRREVTTIPLNRINNVRLSRSLGARLQRSGDVVIDIGEHGLVEIRAVPRVRDFYARLTEEMADEVRQDTDPLPRSHDGEDDTGPLPRVVL
jgi:uncharacterized membrane protein YdbT with pleckstrin-like domain